MYSYILFVLLAIPVIAWVWLSTAASIALYNHSALDASQRRSQIVTAWALPLIGAVFILHMIHKHDPDAMPYKLFPWPLSIFVFNKIRRIHANGGDNAGDQSVAYMISGNYNDSADCAGDE